MPGIMKMIFKPHDGTRERVRKEVASSRENVEKAVLRFEETVRGLMDHNDKVTGRQQNVLLPNPPRK